MVLMRVAVFIGAALMLSGCLGNKAVRVVERFEAEFSEEGAVVETRRVRAWIEDIERDAGAASLVFRAGEGQTIQSLDVAPTSKTITFSLIETAQDDGSRVQSMLATSRYAATLRSVSTTGGGLSQLTTGRWLDFSPAYGPAGYITFDSNRTRPDGRDLFRIAADRAGGVSLIRQTQDGFSFSPAVTPGGTTAFAYKPDYRRRGLPLAQTAPQLWTVGGANGYPTQLREGAWPALSPDGSKIAFIGENGQLWVMNTGGSDQIQLTSSPLPDDPYNSRQMTKLTPSWSADGTRILYASADGKDGEQEPNYDIWVIPANGGTSQQLTTNGSADLMPRAAADGKWIYFVSNRGFTEGIWRIAMPDAMSASGY